MTAEKIDDLRVRLDSLRTLRYLQAGQRAESAVLFLPPLGATADFWRPHLATLARSGRQSFAVDLPGFGASSAPYGTDLAYYARVVHEFALAMQLNSYTLVGNSLGGTIALDVYLQNPDAVRALVLVDAFGMSSSPPVNLWSLWNVALPFSWLGVWGRGNWAYWRTLRAVCSTLPDDVEQRFQVGAGRAWLRRVPQRWTVVLALVRELAGAEQRRAFLAQVTEQVEHFPLPIFILWGEKDRVLPVEQTQEVLAALPDAEVHFFPHTGHHPPAESPAEFDHALIDFLNRHGL